MRLFALPVLASLLLAGGAARADGLTVDETDKLLRGDCVARAQDHHRGTRRYVGGVAYKIVDAAPEELASLLDDVDQWGKFLPKTRDAHRVGAIGADPLVEITHGSALVQVAYTLRVHREGSSVRFWMDAGRAHDIEDAWGFIRAEPMADGRTLDDATASSSTWATASCATCSRTGCASWRSRCPTTSATSSCSARPEAAAPHAEVP